MKLLKTKKDKIGFLDWIAALEAKAVPQAQNCLENEIGMCCLGLSVSLTTEAPMLFADLEYLIGDLPSDQPESPRWLDLIDEDFKSKTGKFLTELNDELGLTFPQIAKKLMKAYGHELEDLY